SCPRESRLEEGNGSCGGSLPPHLAAGCLLQCVGGDARAERRTGPVLPVGAGSFIGPHPADSIPATITFMNHDRIARNLAAVENHFHSEAASDVEAALETFTDDVVWEAPAPNGLNLYYEGKEAAGTNYRKLWASMRNVNFQTLQRFATEDRVVD